MAQNSTNVRQILSLALNWFGKLDPERAATFGIDRFCRTQKRVWAEPTGKYIPLEELGLAAWEWGQGPAVYLLHGWNGSAGQLQSFVAPLVELGHRVIALDAPGHGLSQGNTSHIGEFARGLAALIEREGPAAAVIAHSLGGAAVSLLLREKRVPIQKAVLISSPAYPGRYPVAFLKELGLSPEIIQAFQREFQKKVGASLEDVNLPSHSPEIPVLLLHDREDRDTSYIDSQDVSKVWKNSRLLLTRGYGHRRLLDLPEVAQVTAQFVAGRKFEVYSCVCGAFLCERCQLEREFFAPHLRLKAA